jgi:LacI family transcriptional regulator
MVSADNGEEQAANGNLKVGEIANLAGVSPSTVSKVLNGRSGVAEDTRRHIELLLTEHGVPKPLVSTRLSDTIEVVVDEIDYSNETVELIKNSSYWAQQAGLAITITQLGQDLDAQRALHKIVDRNPLGIILRSPTIDTEKEERFLVSRKIPLVAIEPIGQIPPEAMQITTDNWTSGFKTAQYLLRTGHRRIGIIDNPDSGPAAIARRGGISAAAQYSNFPIDESLIKKTDGSSTKDYTAARELLSLPNPPTAILACGNFAASHVYRVAREKGLRIPIDLSVVGFDTMPYPSELLVPEPAAVHFPMNTIARKAIEMIIDQRRNRIKEKSIVLPLTFIKGESISAPAR